MTTTTLDTTRPQVSLRIGGERRTTASGGTFQHINPCNGIPDAEIPLAGPAEIDEAVKTAHRAFVEWRQTPPAGRRRMLMRLADLIELHTDDFARLGTFDNGTPASLVGWACRDVGGVDALLRGLGRQDHQRGVGLLSGPW